MSDYGMERLLRLALPGRQQMPMVADAQQPLRPFDYNTMRPPESLPYNERFAGGALRSTYTPYEGDAATYGQRAQHRFYVPDVQRWSTATSSGTGTGTGTGTATEYGGGPGGSGSDQGAGEARDSGSQSYRDMDNATLNAYAKDKAEQGILGQYGPAAIFGLGAPVPGVGYGIKAFDDAALAEEIGARGLDMPGIAGIGLSNGQQSLVSPELQGRGDPSQEANARGGSAVDDNGAQVAGNYARGGIVRGDRRHGVDDVKINADGGEGIIRAAEMKKLGAAFLKRLNSGRYDARALRKAAGLK